MASFNIVWPILLVALLIPAALSIKCMQCQSDKGEVACDAAGQRVTCKESLAAKVFTQLKKRKPKLVEPGRNTGYQCLETQLEETATLVKGCIFANLDVCKEFSKAKICSMCKEDDCNSKAFKDGGNTLSGSIALILTMTLVVIALNYLQ